MHCSISLGWLVRAVSVLMPCHRVTQCPRYFLICGALFAAFTAARADTVWLVNGDRISGTIQSLDNGTLLITTEYGGDVRVAFEHVRTLQSDGDLIVRDQSFEHDYKARFGSTEQGRTVDIYGVQRYARTTSPVSTNVPLASLQRVVRPHPFLNEARFTGRLDLALNYKAASTDSQDYSAAFQGGLNHGLWRHTLSAGYARSKEGGNLNTHNYNANYTLDRFVSKRAFWQGRLLQRRDWVEDLRRQTAFGIGPGHQFWDDELGAFSMSALVGRVHYGYSDDIDDNGYAGSVRWDYVRYFSGKQISVYTRGELMRSFTSSNSLSFSGEAGVRYNINSWLSLYLKYTHNRVTSSRKPLKESIYATGIGVSW